MPIECDPSNPDENRLGANVREESLLDAIERSGYPLQGVAARILEAELRVTEEWGFLQGETHRSLDVYGWKLLVERPDRFTAGLALLGECKRSELPYVFFKDVTDRPTSGFPSVSWAFDNVEVHERSGGRFMSFSPQSAFGMDRDPFIANGPARCSSLTRADPKKSGEFRFSGEDPFNRVVLPLIRAVDHAKQLFRPSSRKGPLQLYLLAPVAILDAPMLLVSDPERPRDAVLTPWIRVVRHEAGVARWRENRWYGIDFVHISYLSSYVSDHLVPYTDRFAKAYEENITVVKNGGTVSSLDDFEWSDVEPRQPGAR